MDSGQVNALDATSRRIVVVCGWPQKGLFSDSQAAAVGLSVIQSPEDQDTCLSMCECLRPSVLFCGQPLIKQLSRAEFLKLTDYGRGTRVLAVVTEDGPTVAADMLRLGCCGVVSSSSSMKLLQRAVVKVLEGELWAPRSVVQRMLLDLLSTNFAKPGRCLTPQEQRVLDLIVKGLKNSEIANTLSISAETVRWHKRRLYRKVGRPTGNHSDGCALGP